MATESAKQAIYQQQALDNSEGQLAMLKRYELKIDDYSELIDFCEENKIEFLSSAFDMSSIGLLCSLKPKLWKVPSGEITNLPYLREIGCQGQPVILSTGMSNLGEIEAALSVLEHAGVPHNQITVMHCTTEYPAPLEEVNLRAMITIANSFDVAVGYSDHTEGIVIPIAAVAMGATVIEKHLTLDRNLPGPDHKASIELDQFASMVTGIRSLEQALGNGIKKPTPSEQLNLPLVRKSLVAARPIRCGEIFNNQNLTAKRPGIGISPMNWDYWIGRKAHRDFDSNELLE